VKNYLLRLNLVQSTFSSRIQFESNWSEGIRSGTSVKGFLVNINSAIDPSAYKEIGTKNYWINNCLEIWNHLSVSLGLKIETGYTPSNVTLVRIYKNFILVKFWRTFEIEIKED
jgi:hypothetical protein